MQLIIRNADGTYKELDHRVGQGLAADSAVMTVRITHRDNDNPEALLAELRDSILPCVIRPTEDDFLPQ